jgi:hypothetical protein
MATIETTTIRYGGSIALKDEQFRDEVITFAAAATLLKGTLLGRVTAGGKLKAFATGASDGSEKPVAVLTYDVVAVGAGDVVARPLVKGEVNRNRLIIAADGHGNNLTPAILDQLRDYGITPVDVQQVGQTA